MILQLFKACDQARYHLIDQDRDIPIHDPYIQIEK